jgi:hypothetical protein
LLARIGGAEKMRLALLWRNWNMVMGEELASIALPLGSNGGILRIGAPDSMALNELTYAIAEILERANAFMDAEHFDKVELHLMLGQSSLEQPPSITEPAARTLPPKPPGLGVIGLQGLKDALPGFDPDSPVARCYIAHLGLYK